MAALPVDLAEVIAGTRVGVAGMDDLLNDVVKGTGSCRTIKRSDQTQSDRRTDGAALTH